MSRTFTLVPEDVLGACRDFVRLVAHDPAVLVVVDLTTKVFFASEPSSARDAVDGEGLASIELAAVDGCLRLALTDNAASVEHLGRYLDVLVKGYGSRVTEDRTGEDLTYPCRADTRLLLVR